MDEGYDYNNQRCADCQYCLKLEKCDYSQGGCKHSDMPYFCCMAFASEGIASWMYGLEKENTWDCEVFTLRKDK